jgi:hypothetical protein
MRLGALLCVCLSAFLLAAGASAGTTPRLALFNISTDLASASRNDFGDLHVSKIRSALAKRAPGAALVRCTGRCTFGDGWLAFSRGPSLASGDVSSGRAVRARDGAWAVTLTLTPRGAVRWAAFSRRAEKSAGARGVPDALVLAVDGSVAGQPLANQVTRTGKTLHIVGLSRANALRTAKALG